MSRSSFVRYLVVAVGVVGLQLVSASSALAYFVTISANAVCSDGVATINYTAGSWDSGVPGTNDHVEISFGSTVVQTGAYTLANNNTLSGSAPAPSTGSVTVSVAATGTWGTGDPESDRFASTTVTVPSDCTEVAAFGRFTGGPNAIEVGGTKVTTGLQIHCHPKDPSVNFEINWGGGDNFHLTDVTTVSCFDSPLVTPQPPKAPVDTIIATGYGTYHNVAGYTIEFTLVDSGEPDNKRTDQMRILIYTTTDPSDVKLSVPLQFISAGNIQAHYDQPHGGNGNK
jgi:hypothetical protein